MSRKRNPRSVPVSRADLERAKREARSEAVEYALTIVFTAALDRCGMSVDDVQRLYRETNNVADSINRGYATIAELKWTLRHEADIYFEG